MSNVLTSYQIMKDVPPDMANYHANMHIIIYSWFFKCCLFLNVEYVSVLHA